MDITIQMRSLELLVKMLRQDMAGVPQYGYLPQKTGTEHSEPRLLARCAPEEAGINSAAVEKLFNELDAEVDTLAVQGVMLLRHGKVFAEGCWAPYDSRTPRMLYSMSKSILSTAIGFAYDEGLIDLDETIFNIFPGVVNPQINKLGATITVRHLLTMSTGVRFNEVGSALDANWIKMFMESQPKFEPGAAFEYNSMNSYMLAAILKAKTGKGVDEYLTPRLYDPLGILDHPWEVCPAGIEKGGWGLSLSMEDMAKLGQFYLQDGIWEGQRLISHEWLEMATSLQIETPRAEMHAGYGFQIWRNTMGGYQFNGAFGQYVIVLPALDAVAVIVSGSVQLFAKTAINDLLTACFFSAVPDALPEYPAGYERLCERTKNLIFSPTLSWENLAADPDVFDAIAQAIDGREYRIGPNHGSAFPTIIQNVHGCYTRGIDLVRFERVACGLALTIYEDTDRNTFIIDRMGGFRRTTFGMAKERHIVSSRALWAEEAGDIRISIIAAFVETPDVMLIDIRMIDGTIELQLCERPDAEGAAEMMMELVGLTDSAAVKRLLPAMRHIPGFNEESLNNMSRRFTAPRAFGRLITPHDAE